MKVEGSAVCNFLLHPAPKVDIMDKRVGSEGWITLFVPRFVCPAQGKPLAQKSPRKTDY
jgi:hypothetical protein